jgi:hypothetical protein
MLELGLGVGGIALGILTYVLGVRSGRRTEKAIRTDVAAVPELTARVVAGMLESVAEPPRPDDPDRGWEVQYPATFGFAPLLPSETGNTLLVEFPYGAHSGVLLALEDSLFDTDHRNRIRLRGSVMNGTGARFHVREASDGSHAEVVTLDYVLPLRDDRSMAEMPTQAVYYRLLEAGFQEVGRGEIYDSVEAPWDIPRAVEPFLSPDWVRQQRSSMD